MKWIGLTGGLASGKSTVAGLLRKKGFAVLDADQVAQDVLKKGSPGLKQVVQVFGTDLLGADGELNRKKMAELVFSSKSHLQQLENIVHPLVQEKIRKLRSELEKKGDLMAFYDVPLLFEKNLFSQFDAVIVVVADEATQILRMKSRNSWGDEEIQRRLKSQLPMAEKEKRAHHVIRNHGSLDDLEDQVDQLVNGLRSNT